MQVWCGSGQLSPPVPEVQRCATGMGKVEGYDGGGACFITTWATPILVWRAMRELTLMTAGRYRRSLHTPRGTGNPTGFLPYRITLTCDHRRWNCTAHVRCPTFSYVQWVNLIKSHLSNISNHYNCWDMGCACVQKKTHRAHLVCYIIILKTEKAFCIYTDTKLFLWSFRVKVEGASD